MGESVSKQGEALSKDNTVIYKGFAILIIMICHFVGKFGNGITWFTPLGGIGVSIFLILSGYGLTVSWSKSGYKCWWRKSIISVWIPYILMQMFTFWPFRNLLSLDFVLDITCLNTYYWYVSYNVLWYILFYIVMRIGFLSRYKTVVFLMFAIISFIVFCNISPIRAEQSLSFPIGVIFAELKLKDKEIKIFRLPHSIVIVFIGVLFLAFKQLSFIRNSPVYLFYTVELIVKLFIAVGSIGIIFFVLKFISLKPLTWLGTISYELYLVHYFVFEHVDNNLYGMIIFVVASLAGAFLFWLVIEKTKKYQKMLLRV